MATISSYFGAASGRRPDSDRVILAPTYISPRPNDLDRILIEPDEFKLNGKQYVRYVVVAKSQKPCLEIDRIDRFPALNDRFKSIVTFS
ncbi:hypothetical protein FPOAC2_14486 [Fusarium poae]